MNSQMKLFQKSQSAHVILAPQTGRAVALTEIPDPVFSGKVLGDGAAVIPCGSQVLAPVTGTVVQIASTLHAICMESDDGLDILIHLGLDTVNLKGRGFQCHVQTGQHVKAGTLLMEMDVEQIRSAGLNPVTLCIITNMECVRELTSYTGKTEAGNTVLLSYVRS
ncbi:hypothetical protein B6259_08060 [Ruminococcaceae bacterium CPB6]|jgi:glucose-specific phosphotransferase system IIA component|uniref:PTS glucose transporter subunit IIA n=2 Tax=Oscillospiraceae TaxID=216572 RepID=A0A859DN73_9FIRM|nr:hypothetical protein B6259_08060 [Ruminococcaceae bacterium CPB6]QKN23447.1 PTS glucose transporter subunit IIA [Caproicibacterium lactatifermentans]QKO29874.1 PTS glucose transporter subunit IIA [Caproicibacterium lactatifermentans]